MTFGQFVFWLLVVLVFFGVVAATVMHEKWVRQTLADAGFNPDFMHGENMVSTGIAIDRANEGVAILWPGRRQPTLLDFTDIVGVELRRNNQIAERTNRKRQLVGAFAGKIVAGNVGAVIMGVTASRRHEDKITKLSMVVYTSDLSAPSFEVIFLKNLKGVSATFAAKDERIMDDWYGRMLGIIKIADRLQ